MTDEENETKTVTFELDTDNPKCLLFKIMSTVDLDGEDLISALKKLLELLEKDMKNAQTRELAGH